MDKKCSGNYRRWYEPLRNAVRLRAFWTMSSGLGTSKANVREKVDEVEMRSGALARKFQPIRGGEDIGTSSSASNAPKDDGGAGRITAEEYIVEVG
jgi:hypothetical protein